MQDPARGLRRTPLRRSSQSSPSTHSGEYRSASLGKPRKDALCRTLGSRVLRGKPTYNYGACDDRTNQRSVAEGASIGASPRRPGRRALALRRDRERAPGCAFARLPRVLVLMEVSDPHPRRGRLPGSGTGYARLQPLGQAAQSGGLPRRVPRARRRASDPCLRL